MDSKFYRALTATLWLALPLTALQYWSVWDQLPPRMATHFGASGQPNGWMARDTSLIFALVVTTLVLVSLTWALTRVRKPDVLAWSLLAMLYVVMGTLFSVNVAVLNYNLHGGPLNVVPALAAVFLAAIAVTAVALVTRRGIALPRQADVVEAEEVHGSVLWAFVFTVLTAVELGVIALIPLSGLRWVMALPTLLLLGAAALAGSGFHYRFTDHGVEVSTLGFRLRSIPSKPSRPMRLRPGIRCAATAFAASENAALTFGETRGSASCSPTEKCSSVIVSRKKIMQELNLIKQSQKARENT
jgi:hypothetical protein